MIQSYEVPEHEMEYARFSCSETACYSGGISSQANQLDGVTRSNVPLDRPAGNRGRRGAFHSHLNLLFWLLNLQHHTRKM